MKISIIIPVYNRKKLVKKAVESVLEQSYLPHEVIVVDDGSDEKLEVVDWKLEASRGLASHSRPVPILKTIFHKENKGVSAARNTGINASKGDWLAFLDSDDYWFKDKLREQVDFHKNNSDIFISQTDEIWIRNGRRVNPRKYHQKPEGDIFIPCLDRCLVTPSAVMIHRSILDDVGLFDEDLLACEDYDLWLRIARKYKVGLIKEKLVVKTGGHTDQLSHKYWGMDRFRVHSLKNLIESGFLTESQEKEAQHKLQEKLQILENGARKRNKIIDLKKYAEKSGTVLENK